MIVNFGNGNFYLYRHIRLDKNEPFYIGIGTKIKIFNTFQMEYKRAFSKNNRNKHWHNIINKTDYKVEILLESNDYKWIKQKEIEFITLYGREDLKLGSLVNWTNGGEGTVNLNIEIRKIMSEKATGRKQSEEAKKKISIANKGKQSRLGSINSIECREKLSKTMKEDYKSGKRVNPNKKGEKRDKILMDKINSQKRKKIIQYDLNMNFIKEWESIKSAIKELNYSSGSIGNCLKNRCKSSGGFIWKYKVD